MDHMQSRHTILWAEHIHTERWFCDLSHNDVVEFESASLLLTHLESEHAGRLTKSQINGRVRRNRRIATRSPFVCPLCDSMPVDIKERLSEKPHTLLWEHISRHLYSLAFLSLSYVELEHQVERGEGSTDLYGSNTSSERSDQSAVAPHQGLRDAMSIGDDTTPILLEESTDLLEAEDWSFLPLKDLATNFELLSKGLLGAADQKLVNTIVTRANLASLLWLNGEYREAHSLQVDELELCTLALGQEHPSTLRSINNLASTLWSIGEWSEAATKFKLAVQLRTTLLGPEHPSTLTSMRNLAATYQSLGWWPKAKETYLELSVLDVRVLGPHYPSTLIRMSNWAVLLWEMRRFREAEELEARVLEARRTTLGREHPDTLVSVNNLALTFQSLGRWRDAETLGTEATTSAQKLLGPEHPFTLTSMGNLAATFRNQGRLDQAASLEVQIMEVQKKGLGEEHPDTIATRWNLAHTLRKQQHTKEALELLESCSESQARLLGEEHPHTMAISRTLDKWKLKKSSDWGKGIKRRRRTPVDRKVAKKRTIFDSSSEE
ncbi:hypothetical protein BDV34DRAFT_235422 [Aspergillus parasiticus]|uniref:Tetratricopeptide repeat n=1 Tax=Aspergillus parasiticus TaxID=5067 RepID=A0A5N6E0U0_ASPPA|nr:hypothetical protein BDV34DRAFT_235422 [Aspergillus parasiticus]